MSLLAPDGSNGGGRRRGPLRIVALLGAIVAMSVGIWLSMSSPRRSAPSERVEAPPVAREPAPTMPAAPPEGTAAERRAPSRRTVPEAPAAPAAGKPSASPLLRVTADVDGAFVFVDRKFVGKTPLETTDVSAGTHQINVSAEGYDGVSQHVEIGESGPTELTIRLKAVRLDASVDVVHKHRMGSCDGRLVADLSGVRYETSHREDAFTASFASLEAFSVDYLAKTLRVKARGKTWNFTTRADNADPLFVFHRDVEKARARLGGTS